MFSQTIAPDNATPNIRRGDTGSLTMKLLSTAIGGVILASATAASAVVPFDVRYESEAPGLQATTATFSVGGVETFETHGTGNGLGFTTDFGTGGAISATYSGVDIIGNDQYGGAGGTGLYAVTFSQSGYALDLTSTIPGGVNYFGYWLSALDRGNRVTFYSGGQKLFTFDPQNVLDTVNARANPSQYFGNPNAAYQGQNTGEPYLFINFFNDHGTFDRVEFAENPSVGGYESDNHTVGHFLTKGTGTPVIIPGVPEPESWALLVAGFGLVGAVARRGRGAAVVAA